MGLRYILNVTTEHFHSPGPPVIVVQPSDATVTLSDPVTLICEARGYPTPTIQWSKELSDVITAGIATNSNQFTTVSHLTIDSFSMSDAALYYCTASNKYYPSVSTSARLTLQGGKSNNYLLTL